PHPPDAKRSTVMSSHTVPMIFPDDTARARRNDPLSSSVAADLSAKTRGRVHAAVLWILARYGPLTGNELNAHCRWRQYGMGWPLVGYDSPRKRAGMRVGGGVGIANVEASAKRGTHAVYGLPQDAA